MHLDQSESRHKVEVEDEPANGNGEALVENLQAQVGHLLRCRRSRGVPGAPVSHGRGARGHAGALVAQGVRGIGGRSIMEEILDRAREEAPGPAGPPVKASGPAEGGSWLRAASEAVAVVSPGAVVGGRTGMLG